MVEKLVLAGKKVLPRRFFFCGKNRLFPSTGKNLQTLDKSSQIWATSWQNATIHCGMSNSWILQIPQWPRKIYSPNNYLYQFRGSFLIKNTCIPQEYPTLGAQPCTSPVWKCLLCSISWFLRLNIEKFSVLENKISSIWTYFYTNLYIGSSFVCWNCKLVSIRMSNIKDIKKRAIKLIHTHTRLTALFPGLPGWAGTRKITPTWIFVKQETVSGSGISWAVCKSAPRSRQITIIDYNI